MKYKAYKFSVIIFLVGLVAIWILISINRCITPKASNQSEFFSFIWPEPHSETPIICYMISSNYHDTFAIGRGVGVGMLAIQIDENWIDLPHAPLYTRVHLIVDGKQISDFTKTYYESGLFSSIDDEGNEVISVRPTSTFVSWVPLIFLGNHQAKIVVETDNGDLIEYHWQFKIIW